MFGFFMGMVMYFPMIFGAYYLPCILWKRLDRRFLERRGVPLWKKVIVYITVTIPFFVTFDLSAMLMKELNVYPSDDEFREARELHPRGAPISLLPHFLGLLASSFLIPAVVKVYAPYLSTRFTSLINKLSGCEEIIQESRTWPCELHYFERAIEKAVRPNRYKQYCDTRLLTKEFGYKKSSVEERSILLKSFVHARFIVVLRRRVDGRRLTKRDLYRVKNTVIIAEDEDCLHLHTRSPIAEIKGGELVRLIDKHWSILLHQPNFRTIIGEDLIHQLRTLRI